MNDKHCALLKLTFCFTVDFKDIRIFYSLLSFKQQIGTFVCIHISYKMQTQTFIHSSTLLRHFRVFCTSTFKVFISYSIRFIVRSKQNSILVAEVHSSSLFFFFIKKPLKTYEQTTFSLISESVCYLACIPSYF